MAKRKRTIPKRIKANKRKRTGPRQVVFPLSKGDQALVNKHNSRSMAYAMGYSSSPYAAVFKATLSHMESRKGDTIIETHVANELRKQNFNEGRGFTVFGGNLPRIKYKDSTGQKKIAKVHMKAR